MPLQSVIDTAIVGNMNETAKLAGMGLAIQLLSLLLVSFNFLQYASSGLSAQALGQLANSTDRIAATSATPLLSILQRALLLAFIIGAILLLAKPWLIDYGDKSLLVEHISCFTLSCKPSNKCKVHEFRYHAPKAYI